MKKLESKNLVVVLMLVAILLSTTVTYIAITKPNTILIQTEDNGGANVGVFVEPVRKSNVGVYVLPEEAQGGVK